MIDVADTATNLAPRRALARASRATRSETRSRVVAILAVVAAAVGAYDVLLLLLALTPW